jgi:hypothetical protein
VFVNFTHGEANVNQDPVTWRDTFGTHERNADMTFDTRDDHFGDRIGVVNDLYDLTWNT